MAGVTPRTLHHYDDIGLLKPSRVGDNGYRYYGDESLLRLQQILFYRELDMPLEDIRKIMGRRDFDILSALETHKESLGRQMERTKRLLVTVDNTINHLKGEKEMSDKQLFEAFSDEQQAEYEKEIAQKYDPATVKSSAKKWKAYSEAEKKNILKEGNAIYVDLAANMPKGAGSAEVQAVIARWHKHIQYFWSPNDAQLLGLADLYNEDSRFRENYEKVAPMLAEFMRDAVKVYVEKRKK